MKKLFLTIFATSFFLILVIGANAQMMGRFSNSGADWEKVVEHTLQEEKEGKELWGKLQAKEVTCDNLNDEQYEVLGEYFMGQMMGSSHAAMNAMMMQTHGEQGEEQIHIAMGKRLSGCDTSATFPSQGFGWMSMMQMMWGEWSSPFRFNSTNNMMNFDYGFGIFGWFFMILWWGLIIAAIVVLIKWLANQFKSGASGKSALDILKERYAKGEIDKKEFEDKKRELTS